MKKLLMIAYHFPPLAGSSGIQRTLRFVQHLPTLGWEPVVLTVQPRAYERTSNDLMPEVPSDTVVHRAFALDAARHLAVRGRHFAFTTRPDRWISWRWRGVADGMALIRQHRPDAIWSTYPIASAHVIGSELQRRSGLPWIADFRDPMAQPGFPCDPVTRAQYHALEARVVRQARLVTLTTPSAARSYAERYPHAADRIALIENGYDEASFQGLGGTPSAPLNPGALTLLHSGIVYQSERDPTQLFGALAELHRQGRILPQTLKLRFRAAQQEDYLRRLAAEHGVQDFLEILPPIPYKEALQEMMHADALMLLQAANCNEQVPAKLYEYLRAGRPILCLTDPVGDTATVLRQAGVDSIWRLDDRTEIAAKLPVYLGQLRAGQAPMASAAAQASASRNRRSEQLAQWLNRLVP